MKGEYMENLREFIDALFTSETSLQKREKGMRFLVPSKDNDWKRLSKCDGDAATMFYNKYIDKKKTLYRGHLAEPNRPYKEVYYFAFLDKKSSQKIKSGVYVVYLLSADHKTIYFCLAAGVSAQDDNAAQNKVEHIRKQVKSSYFESILPKESWIGDSPNAKEYLEAIAYYKKYSTNNRPSNDELEADFEEMMKLYEAYINKETVLNTRDGETEMVVNNHVNAIIKYIASQGYTFDNDLIKNYYLSLKSKPFVILAGISGTGKSKLVRLFAEACGATVENGQYMLLPVRPDWSDGSDLLGHWTLNNEFKAGPVTIFIDNALKPENANKPFFLCLDEMNLARVEYYFSDFLSVIETRRMSDDGEIVTDTLGTDLFKGTDYEGLTIPDNLYVIGTVNMDETTFPFSRKVLDRANTIEFSSVHLVPTFDEGSEHEPEDLTNSVLRPEYLGVPKEQELRETVIGFCQKLQSINDILEQCNAQVAFRVRDEALAYYLAHKKEQLFEDDNTAMDYIIMQKLLPRLQGSCGALKQTLCDLFVECAGKFEGMDDVVARGDAAEQMRKILSDDNKYKRSAKKLYDMVRRFEEDGFTSFWA